MQDVCQQQFLVLLFVVRAELDALERLGIGIAVEQALDRFINVLAVAQDFVEPRTRKRRAQAFLGEGRETLVITVEEPGKVWMEDPVAGQKFAQNEGLEEP